MDVCWRSKRLSVFEHNTEILNTSASRLNASFNRSVSSLRSNMQIGKPAVESFCGTRYLLNLAKKIGLILQCHYTADPRREDNSAVETEPALQLSTDFTT